MTNPRIIAADHPALERDVARFIADLGRERRYFGPTARSDPKPLPSSIAALRGRHGFRLAAIRHGRIVGLIRVDVAGDVTIGVAAGHRDDGVGTALGRAALSQAIEMGYRRLVVHATHRSRTARSVGEGLGCTVIDSGPGRTELILDLDDAANIA